MQTVQKNKREKQIYFLILFYLCTDVLIHSAKIYWKLNYVSGGVQELKI